MRYEQFESADISYAYKVNTIKDVLDLKRFPKRSFVNYKTLFNKRTEVEAKKLATDIFVAFLKKLAYQLIEENDIYIFPANGFGYIKISNTADPNREDYVYDIESEGKIWTPKLTLDPELNKRNKKTYKLRFNQPLRQKMYDMIKAGHKYG